jgi:hypothetical protein
MLTIQSASNPKYSMPDNSSIYLDVKFAEFNEVLPFNATPNDPMSYGVELYNRAKAGEFGSIAAYTAPPQLTQPKSTGLKTA